MKKVTFGKLKITKRKKKSGVKLGWSTRRSLSVMDVAKKSQ
jgi:hypothetical protein